MLSLDNIMLLFDLSVGIILILFIPPLFFVLPFIIISIAAIFEPFGRLNTFL